MSFSNYTAQAILNSLFGKASAFGALASAPTIFVALSSTEPAEDGTNITEPVDGEGAGVDGYARVETAASDWNAATDADPSVVTNAEIVAFPTATGTWLPDGEGGGESFTHFALFDAAEGGNYLGKGALNTPKPTLDGDTASFPATTLSASLD